MTTITDRNVHNLAVTGTFDDCQVSAKHTGISTRDFKLTTQQQDIVKALFGDPDTNKTLNLGAVNSINFSRILSQIVNF
jgi:threonine synthase